MVMKIYTFINRLSLLPTRNITCKVNSFPLNFKNTDGSTIIKC